MYTGYKEFVCTDDNLTDFYINSDQLAAQFIENEYLLISDIDGKIVDKYCFQNGQFRKVLFPTINNKFTKTIKPRNDQQILALDLLQDRRSKVKLIRGVYGSGKDFLMLNQALDYVESGEFEKIVYIRPNVTVANVPDIGYLKGSLEEKLEWTLAPLYDKVGGRDGVEILIDRSQLEMVPLLHIRGRSFENSLIYVCEAQNITSEIAKLIISRVGEGSELWLNSDTHQTDNKVYEKDNGIIKMIDKLSGNKLFGYVYLPKTERGEVAELATLLDD